MKLVSQSFCTHILFLTLFLGLMGLNATPVQAQVSIDIGGGLSISVSRGADDPEGDGYAYGEYSTCAQVRTSDGEGGISGGTAGFQAYDGEFCASGGGQSFCGATVSHTYECAGAALGGVLGPSHLATEWPAFEPDPEEAAEWTQEDWAAFNSSTSRDEFRGRAGDDQALWMDAYGICRWIDKTDAVSAAVGNLDPIFVPAGSEAEYRTFHGAPASDPSGGFDFVPGIPEQVPMEPCCRPITVTVCGVPLNTGYQVMGEQVQVFTGWGAATLTCQGNNDWRLDGVSGICGLDSNGDSGPDSGGGGVGGESNGGYSNPDTGGQISQDTWDGLDSDVQSELSDAGYGSDPSVNGDDAQGREDIEAAEAAVETEEMAEEQIEQAEEAEEEANEDDDDP